MGDLKWSVMNTREEAIEFVKSRLTGAEIAVFDVDDTLVSSDYAGDIEYGTKLHHICKDAGSDIFYVTARPDHFTSRAFCVADIKSTVEDPIEFGSHRLKMHRKAEEPDHEKQKYIHRRSISSDGKKPLVSIGDRITDLMNQKSLNTLYKLIFQKKPDNDYQGKMALFKLFRISKKFYVFENCDDSTSMGVLVPTSAPLQ